MTPTSDPQMIGLVAKQTSARTRRKRPGAASATNPKAYRKGDDAMTVTAAEELRANLWPICTTRAWS
jgi:hypothetical protein